MKCSSLRTAPSLVLALGTAAVCSTVAYGQASISPAVPVVDRDNLGEHRRAPASWRLVYRDAEGGWQPVQNVASYPTERNTFNDIIFESVETDALRIEAQLRNDFSAGVWEWHIMTDAGVHA